MSKGIRRERMLRELRERGIADERVLGAMAGVPRERFVPDALQGKAYADAALPIGLKQTISQPWIVARMTELLEPDGTGRVLEIGTGSGYQTAILSPLFDRVFSVERIRSLSEQARVRLRELGIENAHFKIFDGSYGWSEFAPYRGILVTAAVPGVPQPLIDQLEEGGRLVIPVGSEETPDEQILTRVVRTAKGPVVTRHGRCRFVPLIGRLGWSA